MKEWKNERMKEWGNERMKEWKNERMKKWKNEKMKEWKNERMRKWKMTHDNILYELSKKFALRVIRLYTFLCEEKKEFIMSKQIYRSGTSIGANIAESMNAQSRADFLSKLSISLKEASETKYWLELLRDSDNINSKQFDSIANDLNVFIFLQI